MSKLIVVEEDIVSNTGKDKHTIIGTNTSTTPQKVETKQFSYDFSGKVKEKAKGNDFVTIQEKIIITKDNNECPQTQNHTPDGVTAEAKVDYSDWYAQHVGTKFAPDEPDNNGENSDDAGSSFVTISGAPIILNGDNFDTCHAVSIGSSNTGRYKNSTVESSGQYFVKVSE